jgi:hypothetical protein
MSGKRNAGGMAAIGTAAALILLAGFPAAMADELSDLRANQQALQQQLNQLQPNQTQAGPQATPPTAPAANGASPPPDLPLLGGSFPRSFVIPGTDTSVRVGGSIDETLNYRDDR